MNRLLRLVVLSAVIALIGCQPPFGSIDRGTAAHETLWAVPNRWVYNINDPFDWQDDLIVFAAFQGLVETIPVESVIFSIMEDPDSPDVLVPVPPSNSEFFVFRNIGRNIVVLYFDNMFYQYSVQVQDPLNIGGGGGGGSGGGGGIGIIWDPPVPRQ